MSQIETPFRGEFMKSVICALVMLSSLAAYGEGEGGVGHGGGVAYVCNENGKDNAYLVDTYALTKAGAFDQLKPNSIIESNSVIEAIVLMLEITKPAKNIENPMFPGQYVSLGWMVEHTSASIDMQYSEKPLPLQPDAHIDNVPTNCRLAQLAIQDVGVNRLKLDLNIYSKLSRLDQGFFKLHEAYISMRNQAGADTTPIRAETQTVAQVIADPNFSESAVIAKLIGGPKFIPSWPTKTTWAASYVQAHCRGLKTLLPVFDVHLLAETVYGLACPFAQEKFNGEMLKVDEDSAFPTLQAIPQQLDCQIVNHGYDMLNWKPTSHFRLVRRSGNGMPYSPDLKGNAYLKPSPVQFQDSKYEIDFTDNTSLIYQTSQDLITHRHQRQRGIDEIGDLDFRLGFQSGNNKALFFINTFLPTTGLFYGDLQLSYEDEKSQADYLSRTKWTNYGISCSAPYNDVKFDKDLHTSWN
jgi:hypothetical protein